MLTWINWLLLLCICACVGKLGYIAIFICACVDKLGLIAIFFISAFYFCLAACIDVLGFQVLVIPEVQRLVSSQVAAGEGVSRQQRDIRLQVLYLMT